MEYNFTYREKDKGWQVILSYKDTNGKWHQKSKQGLKGRSAAKTAGDNLLEYVKEKELHIVSGSKDMTFERYSEDFLNDIANTLEYNTVRNYEQAIEAFEAIKRIPMIDISYADVNNAYNEILKVYKTSTANFYLTQIRAMFNKAVKPYKIIKSNPTDDIVLRKNKADKKINALTKERLKILLEGLEKINYTSYVIVNIAAYAGLRIGEILGLQRTDIDFSARTITINRQHVLKSKNTYDKKAPKSKNSYRTVPIPKELADVLQEYKKREPENVDGFLFHNMSNSKIYNHIQRVEKGVSIHSLRHTYATNLLANGIDIKTVAALLGDTVETVLKTYVHYNDDMREKAAEMIDKIFFGTNF